MAKKKKTIKETVEETAKKAKAAVETASKDNKKTGRENQTPRAVSKSNSSDRKNTSSANKGNGSTGRESQTPRASSRNTVKKDSSRDYHESRRIEYNKTFSEKRDAEKQKNAQKELEAQKAVLGKKRESTAPKNVMEAVKNGTVDWTKVTQDANSKKALEYTTENGHNLYNTSKGIVDDIKNRYGGKLPTATKADREAAANGDTMAKKRLEDAGTVKYHQGQMKLLSPYQDAWNPTGKTAADIGEAFQKTQKKKKAEKEAKVTRESQIPVDEVMEAVENGTVDWTKVAQNANAKRARAVEENRTTAERLHDNKMRLAEIKEMEKSTVGKMIAGNPADMPTDDLANMKKLLREKEQLEKRIQADQSAINAEVDKVTAEKDQRHTTLEKKNYDPAMFEQPENHTFETYEEWDAWRDSVKAQEAIIRAGEEEISIWQKLRRPQEKELAISNAEIRDAETVSANRGSQMHGGDAEKIQEKRDALTEDVREVDQMILAEREKIAEAKKKLMNLKKYGRAIVTKEEEIDGNAAELPNTMKNATVLGKVDWSKVVNEAVAEEKIRSWVAKPKAETPKGESGVVDAIKSKVGAAAKNARADAGCEVEVPGGTEHMRWEDVAAYMKDGIIRKTSDGKYKTTVLGNILWKQISGMESYVDINVTTENNAYAWPTDDHSHVTSEFGTRVHPISGQTKHHNGMDIAVPEGTAIHAAKDGKVIFSGWKGGYGNCVMIDHGDGMVTLYGHNSALSVNVGDTVSKGQTIAKAGSTGNSTGPHCHFEVRVNGSGANPRDYLGEVTTETHTAHVPNAERLGTIEAFRKEREAVYDNIERLYGDTIMHKVYGKEYDNLSDEEKTAVKKQWRYDRTHPVVDEETRELAWRESRGESAFRQGEAVRYAQPSQTQLEQAERDKRAQKQAAAFDKIRQNDRWNGNIRISSRPIMGDKTLSGEKADAQSYVIEENGKQILIPSVIWDEGKWKVATKEEATMRYHLTGEHYGTFEVPEEADVYKAMIWNSEVMRQENDGDLKAQLVEHRTMDLFDATLGAAAKGYVEAKYSRESFKEMMGTDNKKEKYAKILEEDFYEKSGSAIYEWFEGASSLLGQQVMTHTSAEALFGLGTGAIIGGAKGLTVDSADGGLTLGTATIGGALSGGMRGWNVGSAAVMGEIEAGGAYNEMIEMGIDPATARRVALGVGAINTGIEYIQLNGLTKMIEGTAIPKGGLKKAAKALAMYGVDVGKEATQEMAQETVTIAGVQFAMKQDQGKWAYSSDEVVKRVAKTGVDSYLSFMLMNGAGHMMNGAKSIIAERNAAEQAGEALLQRDMAMNELLQNPETGPVVRELGWAADSVEAVMQQGLQMPQGEKAFRMAQANMARMEAGETLSAAEVGEQIKANAAAYQKVQDGSAATLTKKQQAAIRKAITDAGVTDTQAANILIQVARPGENSYGAVDATEWVENAKSVVEAVQSIEADHEGATLKNILKTALDGSKKTAAELGAEHGEGLDRAALTRATLSMMKTGEMTEDYLYSVADAVYTSLARQSRKAGNELLVSRAEGISHMIEYMEGAQGEDSAADLRSYYTVRDALIIQAAADMDAYENVIGEGAGAFLASARETVSRLGANPIRIQSRFGLTGAMENGTININEGGIENVNFSNSRGQEREFGNNALRQIAGLGSESGTGGYAGDEGGTRQSAERILADEISASGTEYEKSSRGQTIVGKLHSIPENKKTRSMKIIERVYQRRGLTVRWATNLKFQNAKSICYAAVDLQTGEVILPLDTDRNILFTAFHELGHTKANRFGEHSQAYHDLVEAVYRAVIEKGSTEEYDALLSQYEANYKSLYAKGVAHDSAEYLKAKAMFEEELMMDIAAQVMLDGEMTEAAFGEQAGAVLRAVNALYGENLREAVDSFAEEEVKEAPAEEQEKDVPDETAPEPSPITEEDIQDLMEEYGVDRKTAERFAKEARVAAGVRYMAEKIDNYGEPYWNIETEDDIFRNIKNKKDLQKAAFEYILHGADYMEVDSIIDGEPLTFRRISAEEYVYGRQTNMLRQQEKETGQKLYSKKLRMAPSIPDLIQHATVSWNAPDEKNHKAFPHGWKNYRGRVRLDDVIFHYVVRVGEAKNGHVFYDINLEVDHSLPHSNTASDISRSTSDDNKVSQNETVVNNHSMQNPEKDTDIRYSTGKAQSESDVLFSLDDGVAKQFDEWDKKGRPSRQYFDFGKPSEALTKAGVSNGKKIIFDASKVLKILKEHPEITIDTLKGVNGVLQDPILVLKSLTQKDSLVIFGDLRTEQNEPVMVALRMDLRGGLNSLENVNKVTSVYARQNVQSLIARSEIKYLNPNDRRTATWFQSFGLQLPSDATSNGSSVNHSMPQNRGNVNNSEEDNDIRYSTETPVKETTNPLEPLVETYGAIPKGENPVREVEVPQQTSPKMYTSLFARTAMESNAVPDEMQGDFAEMVASGKMSHERLPNQVAADHATEMVRERGFEGALRDWQGYIRSGETLSPNQLAVGQLLFNMAADAKNTDLAMKLASDLAVEATKAGRSVQAFRLLKTMTPEGQLYTIEKQVEKINRELDETAGKKGKKREKITLSGDAANRILNAKDKTALDQAVQDAEQEIADQLPVTLWEKFKAWRYLSMLANPRTHIRNIIGNAAFVPAVGMKNAIGTVIERTTPKEQRTKAFHATKEARDFAKADFSQMVPILTGQSKYNVQTGIEGKKKIFKTPFLEKIREFNGDALEGEDLIFLRHHYVNSLAKAITARGHDISYLTSGTKQANRALEEIREYAVREAQRATYRDASKVAEALNKFQHMNKVAEVAVDSFVPFKQTPVNIMKRGVEYSPIGVIKGMVELVKSRKTGETAKAIDSISAGLSGTGLMVFAMLLAHFGILRGSKDDDDKVAMLEELQGIQDYSIKIGDYSYTLDWLAPMSMPMFVGVELMRIIDEGGISFGDAVDAIARIGDPLYEMTMLQGLQSAFRSVSYSGEGPLTNVMEQMVLNYFGQAVPTLFGQFARTIDGTRRMTYTPSNSPVPKVVSRMVQQQKAKIPGLSRLLEPRVDNWGREKKYEGNWVMRAISNFFSPGYISKDGTSEVEAELEQLYRASGDSGVLPSSANKYFSLDGETKYLTGAEYTQYAKERGSVSYEVISRIIGTPVYQNASDEDRAAIIGNAYVYANSVAKARVSSYHPDGWVAKQKASGLSVADYIVAYTLVHGVEGDKYVDANGEEQGYKNSRNANREEALREAIPGISDEKVSSFLETLGGRALDDGERAALEQSKSAGRNVSDTVATEITEAQEVGIDAGTYMQVFDAVKDVHGDKDENGKSVYLSKSRKVKAIIDEMLPDLSREQRHTLYEQFDVSNKVW